MKISYDSSVGSRGGWGPLPTPMMKQFISLVADFTFISREHILEQLPMTASET